MSSIETAIRKLLTDDSDVTDIVGARIYPVAAPQGATVPFVVYEIESVAPVDSLGGHSGLSFASFSISMWSNSYATTNNLGTKIRAALLDFTGTSDTILVDWCKHNNSTDIDAWTADGAEFPLYGNEQTYRVAYQV